MFGNDGKHIGQIQPSFYMFLENIMECLVFELKFLLWNVLPTGLPIRFLEYFDEQVPKGT